MKRSIILGALTGAALAFMVRVAGASDMTPPPWTACVAADDPGCATGGDDVLEWDEYSYGVNIAFQWLKRVMIYRRDPKGADTWQSFALPVAGYWLGDCDDYVLTMRRKAIEWGAPPDALRPLFLWDKSDFHLVLTVWTDEGVKVFDHNELYRCRLRLCQTMTPKVWDYEDYIVRPNTALIAIYEPGGTWRPAAEGWTGALVTRAANIIGGGE